MDQVCIPVPMPAEGETLQWGPDASPDERVEQLRTFIRDYAPDWSLGQVGSPGEGTVPITFRQRHSAADEAS